MEALLDDFEPVFNTLGESIETAFANYQEPAGTHEEIESRADQDHVANTGKLSLSSQPIWPEGVEIDTASDVTYLTVNERLLIMELNKVRSNPSLYAELYLEPMLKRYRGRNLERPGEITILTQEGAAAVNECISALQNANPVGLLFPREGLSKAAADHVSDQGPTGKTGHSGSDGSSLADRVERYGEWDITIGENIDYGHSDPAQIVAALLIDDGVPSRGHRKNVLNDKFGYVGVAIDHHAKYGYMCVMDLAGSYKE
jgi:uncharacterized protein YkwD